MHSLANTRTTTPTFPKPDGFAAGKKKFLRRRRCRPIKRDSSFEFRRVILNKSERQRTATFFSLQRPLCVYACFSLTVSPTMRADEFRIRIPSFSSAAYSKTESSLSSDGGRGGGPQAMKQREKGEERERQVKPPSKFLTWAAAKKSERYPRSKNVAKCFPIMRTFDVFFGERKMNFRTPTTSMM